MLDKNEILSRLDLARRMYEESVTRENKEFYCGKIHAFKEVLEIEIGDQMGKKELERTLELESLLSSINAFKICSMRRKERGGE